jgi:hypothetical protein
VRVVPSVGRSVLALFGDDGPLARRVAWLLANWRRVEIVLDLLAGLRITFGYASFHREDWRGVVSGWAEHGLGLWVGVEKAIDVVAWVMSEMQ